MTEAIFQKRPPRSSGEVGLFATDEQGAELLAHVKGQCKCEITTPRNPRHHRLLFAIMKFLRTHCEDFAHNDEEIILIKLKLATGLVRVFVNKETGEVGWVPKSIAFASMDQKRFAAWFDEATAVIARRWMPGNTPEEIRAELLAMVDGQKVTAA